MIEFSKIRALNKHGFTLVELMVAVSIFLVVVSLGVNMFFTIMKSAKKAALISEIRQNGDYALVVMEMMLRNAQNLEQNSDGAVCELGMKKVKIQNQDEGETEFACLDFGMASGRIASNSARLTSDVVRVKSCAFDCVSEGGTTFPKISITFILEQAALIARPEESVSQEFKITITLRNP